MKIVGLDLSLTATGLAVTTGQGASTSTLRPATTLSGVARLEWLCAAIRTWVGHADLAVMEGPSYGSQARQSGHHERAGLWWLVRVDLDRHEIPVAVVPPATLKRWATGSGKATKDDVLIAAVTRFRFRFPDIDVGNNNEADALWLASLGAHHLGAPIVDLPKTHLAALPGVAWPDLLTGVAS